MSRPRILLVEDNPSISKLVEYKLAREDFDFQVVDNGVDGLSRARSWKPDLLILDVMMPGMSGFDVLQSLRDDPDTAGMAVMMLTSKNREEDLKRGFDLGVKEYMGKPFKVGELLMRVNRILGR